ncbi:MAG: hypothetical protein LBO06_08945 [Bacteroidales bacterium]|jgi:hypothetical protein|nr:hypothetical protein [Bacteroidales bacterium]
MKKNLLAFMAVIIASTLYFYGQKLNVNSDLVKWGEDVKLEDKSSRYDYIGSIDGNDYYAFGYYSSGMMRRFNRVGFMKVKDGVMVAQNNDYIKLPLGSLVATLVLDDELCILYQQENKKADAFELRSIRVDKNTLKQRTDNVLISVDLKKNSNQDIAFFPSSDRKCFAAMLMTREKKSDLMQVRLFYYDSNMNEVWNSGYSSQSDAMITPLAVVPTSHGSIYILSKQTEYEKGEKSKLYTQSETATAPFVIAKITEDNVTEQVIDQSFPCSQARLFEVDENKLFIAFSNRLLLTSVEYNFETEGVVVLPDLKYAQDKQKTYWSIDKIIQLDNGNVVVLATDDYVSIVTDNTIKLSKIYAASNTYYGRNFYILCYNADKAELVYSKMISRAVMSYSNYAIGFGQYENILLFSDENDVYAVYNADRSDNDLSDEVFIESQTMLPGDTRKATGNMVKISENGEVTLTSIVPCKELGLVFSPAISFKSADKTIQINAIKGKSITFGELILK